MDSAIWNIWPILLGLAYLLATAVLLVLSIHRNVHVTMHDRIRESRALRFQYMEMQRRKREAKD